MKETLLSVKKETKQIIDMMEENKNAGSPPMSPVEVKVVLQNTPGQNEPPPPPPPYSPTPMVQPMQMQPGPMYHTQPIQMYSQQGPMAQQQAMQIQPQQTQVVICSGDLGDVPTMTTCRNCGEKVQTRVVYHSGAFAWLICGLCLLFGHVCGCCVIPFFVDSCKDAHHFCSKRNVNLSIHKRM
ncbi:lipopolysaccharide-induced tumor necrosis factor-alpha factor homolog [Alosa alosa]|nr:lipopolysaccharide-induced tumor necrosis factor-alpha factor homolog [Alosa alosa]